MARRAPRSLLTSTCRSPCRSAAGGQSRERQVADEPAAVRHAQLRCRCLTAVIQPQRAVIWLTFTTATLRRFDAACMCHRSTDELVR